MLVAIPVAAQVLPQALAGGLSRSTPPVFSWWWLAPLAGAALVWRLRSTDNRVLAVTVSTAAAVLFLKAAAFPAIDSAIRRRPLWREIADRRDQVCIGEMHRAWRYGLNYYSVTPLPDCSAQPKPFELRQDGAGRGRPAPPHLIELPR